MPAGVFEYATPDLVPEIDGGITQEVAAAKPAQRRTSGGPERNAVEQLRELVEPQERHEHAIAEMVRSRQVAAVPQKTGVQS